MNHNIIERNERLQKVSEALPLLPTDTLIVNDYTNALSHLQGVRWNIFSHEKDMGLSHPPTVEGHFSQRWFDCPPIKNNFECCCRYSIPC